MNSFSTPTMNSTHYSTTPTMNNTSPAPTSTFQSAELANLLNIVMKYWKEQPNHFGFPKFDDFLKKLPEYYYALIQQYQQQIIRQQQLQQQQQLQMQQQQTAQQKMVQQQPKMTQPIKDQKSQPVIECNNKSTVKAQQQKCSPPVNENKNEQQQQQQQQSQAVLKSTQKKRGYKVRASRKPKLEAIEEEKPLTPSITSSPFSSPSVSPSPPSYDRLNASAPEFVPNDDSSPSSSPQPIQQQQQKPNVSYTKLQKFEPMHAARAKLNIYIPKHMTKGLLAMIAESFPNTNTLYYYLDISTALQINDEQMEIILTKSGEKVVIVNFDLHKKGTHELLYAIVTPNDEHKIEANTQKWLWKLDGFYTIHEICEKYNILPQDFPLSSRLMKNGIYQKFAEQYNEINRINNGIVNLLKDYKWESNEIKIIGSSQKSKKGKKAPELRLNFDRDEWINQVLSSWNNNYPLIPIVVYENRDINKHWIEWVKLIYIQQSQSFVGITFKYNDNNNKWQIESICLDKGDIHNKHRLIGLQNIESRHNINYGQYFDSFSTRITEIEWR